MRFTKVQEIFAGDNGEYVNFLSIIKDDVAEAREILRSCTDLAAAKAYGDLKHNMISTVRVFALEELNDLFEEGKIAIDKKDRTGLQTTVARLIASFDAFDAALDTELGR